MDGFGTGQSGERGERGRMSSVRGRVAQRLREESNEVLPRLTASGRGERGSVAAGVVRRLGVAGGFGAGAAGRGARTASRAGYSGSDGPALFVGAGQRVMVKAFIGRHSGAGAARNASKAITRHLRYLAREGMGQGGTEAAFFGPEGETPRTAVHEACAGWEQDRHHFRLIISPEHGDRIEDLEGYVRSVLRDVAADLKEPRLEWMAVNHFDTGHPHTHVLVRGKRANGRDLIIPRTMMGHGIRRRAEQRAQELLGDQSRGEAERGLFARAAADRWTDIDVKMAAIAEAHGGRFPASELARRDVFGAVMRARLQHLERLGLVVGREVSGVQLAPDAKARLNGLQAAQDQIRSHWAAERNKAFDRLPRGAHRALLNATERSAHAGAEVLARIDPTTPHLTGLDVELMKRGQLGRADAPASILDPATEVALQQRADWLVSRGDVARQGQGLGYRPDAWARLRDAEITRALRDQLGIERPGHLSHGRTEGVVAGTITTSLGRQAVIDRGLGLTIAPLVAGQEVSVGQVIGRELGLQR